MKWREKRRLGHPYSSIGCGEGAFRRRDVRAALQELRRQARWNLGKSDIVDRRRYREGRGRLADQDRQRVDQGLPADRDGRRIGFR